MKWLAVAAGSIAFLLGSLWALQGFGLVTMQPIACVGDCTALVGPHAGWAAAGLALLLAGATLILWSLRSILRKS